MGFIATPAQETILSKMHYRTLNAEAERRQEMGIGDEKLRTVIF